jgi:hypothetical protein
MRQVFACAVALVAGTLATASGAQAQSAFGDPLFTVLVGGNECVILPAPQQNPVCRRGDLDGIGSATIIFPTEPGKPRDTVCWGITVDNLDRPTAAHIHRGSAAVNGGIVVGLSAPIAPAAGNPGTSSGCTKVTEAIVAAIIKDPTSFYVNVHTGKFPAGAIRGQLH